MFSFIKRTFLFLSIPLVLFARELTPETLPELGESVWRSLLRDEILVSSTLTNLDTDQQRFDYHLALIHPQNCPRAFSKLSLYESFKEQMDFVKKSDYSEKSQQLEFLFDHTLLPYPIVLKFKIPRIRGTGIYPFEFNQGFFNGLKGKVYVDQDQYEKRKFQGCLIQVVANWKGQHIGVGPFMFNAFSTTLSKLGSEKLLRYSRF